VPQPSAPLVVFRQATADDLPFIVAMRDALNALELAGCPHAPIQRLSVQEFHDYWGPSLDDPDYCWRVIEVAGRTVGFGLIYLTVPKKAPQSAFIHWAYLDETHRGQGIGKRLLDHLIAWARGRGAECVQLQFIEGNAGAERFWTREGFRTYASRCVLYLSTDNETAYL
jgi:GNAT superfamily N-acetyltransferase